MVLVDNEGYYWIALTQIKTRDNLDIPMIKEAVRIFNKFETHRQTNGFVLPMLTNQKVNAHLKVIADLIGLKKGFHFTLPVTQLQPQVLRMD